MKGVFYMALKRSKETVIADILEFGVSGECKTSIVNGANMNSIIVGPYLNKLINMGLLQIINEGYTRYKTTEKGREILRSLKNIEEEIAPF